MASPWQVLETGATPSWLSRTDARSRLGWFVLMAGATIAARSVPAVAFVLLVAIAVAVSARLLRATSRALLGLAWVLLVVGVLNVVWLGAEGGILATLRLALALSLFALLMSSTSPESLADALVSLGVPFRFAFTLSAGARFVPTVAREVQEIVDAYRARGLAFEESPLARARVYTRVLVPLVIATVQRSIRLAEAMEARAFGAVARRGRLHRSRLGWADAVLLGGSVLVLGITLALSIILH